MLKEQKLEEEHGDARSACVKPVFSILGSYDWFMEFNNNGGNDRCYSSSRADTKNCDIK